MSLQVVWGKCYWIGEGERPLGYGEGTEQFLVWEGQGMVKTRSNIRGRKRMLPLKMVTGEWTTGWLQRTCGEQEVVVLYVWKYMVDFD